MTTYAEPTTQAEATLTPEQQSHNLYSVDDAALIFHVDNTTIRRWAKLTSENEKNRGTDNFVPGDEILHALRIGSARRGTIRIRGAEIQRVFGDASLDIDAALKLLRQTNARKSRKHIAA